MLENVFMKFLSVGTGSRAGGRDDNSLRLPSFILFMAAAWLFPASASAADWPMFRGNAARTGFTAEQAYPPFTAAWEFQVQGDVLSSPVVYDGKVYFGARSGSVYALDARTGELVWDYSSDGWIDASPAVSSAAVFMPSMDGRLYALDRGSGNVLWAAELGGPSASSPLYLDGKVYVGVGLPRNSLKAFDAATGAMLFEKRTALPGGQPVDSAPSSDGETVFFGANDGRAYAVDAESGASSWPGAGYYQTIGGSYGLAALAVSSGTLYAIPGRDERRLFTLSAQDGSQLGVTADLETRDDAEGWMGVTSPALDENNIYLGAGSAPHSLMALSRASLEGVWASSPTLGNISDTGLMSSPALAGGVISAGTSDGRLVFYSTSGALLQQVVLTTFTFSSPAVSNGMVYIGTQGGNLMAWRAARAAALSSPAPAALVTGTVTVRGYIENPALSGYLLEYAPASLPSSWTTVVSSSAAAALENAVLAAWDTSGLGNGEYLLRLTAVETPAAVTDNTAVLGLRVNHPPQPPASLTAADMPADNGNRIGLGWTASVTGGVTAYRIYRSTGGAYSLLASAAAPAVTYTDAAAVTGTAFTYVVRAFDGWAESADSPQASAVSVNDDPSSDGTAPSAAADLAAGQGSLGGRAALAWTAPGNDGIVGAASHYEIRYASYSSFDWGGFSGASLWKSSRPVSGAYGSPEAEEVSGLFGGVTYYFRLKAYDFNGNAGALSNPATAWATLDLIPPAAPSELAVTDTNGDHGGRLTLTWGLSADDGSGAGDVYGYKVYRSLAAGQYVSSSPYASAAAGETGYIDQSATVNLKYYYSVAAFDSTNNSTMTAEAHGISADNWRFFDAAQGGTVRLQDGAEVNIPRNAANQNDNIMVTRLNPSTYQPLFTVRANTAVRPTGVVYEVKFENPATKLTSAAEVLLPYTDADIAGLEEENLRIYKLAGPDWRLLDTSEVLPEANKVRAETDSFSVFSIMQYVPSGALMTAGAVYTYPNPAKGDSLTFKFYVADKASVSIDVYNVAGEKVARLTRENCPAGLTSEIAWDIRKIASGVYVYRVKAESASGAKTVTKKLAIIH